MQNFGLAIEAKCITEGLMMHPRGASPTTGGWVTTPLTLQPLLLPRESFDYAMSLTPVWNCVLDRVAHDVPFLLEAMEPIAKSDPFTDRILDMYKRVYTPTGGRTTMPQRAMLGIFRSDYMRDDVAVKAGNYQKEWKHIEINTIAASFPAQSTKAGRIHLHIQNLKKTPSFSQLPWPQGQCGYECGDIQVSDSLSEVTAGLFTGHSYWEEKYLKKSKALQTRGVKPVICYVVDDGERNTIDQHALAIESLEKYGAASVRKSFQELEKEMTMVENDDESDVVDGVKGAPHAVLKEAETGADLVVTVFYFRTGYHPSQFPTDVSWAMRQKIEESSGLKCPSLPHYLCTWKQIQQLLSHEDVLTKFTSEVDRALLKQSMVGQYPVGEHLTTGPVQRAIDEPDSFVLKSQLEGGGNLLFGEEMKELLVEAVADEKSGTPSDPNSRAYKTKTQHILMERIVSSVHSGSILKPGGSIEHYDALIPELGTYGVLLSEGKEELHTNRAAGYLVRTKPRDVADGGIMSGLSALDVVAFK